LPRTTVRVVVVATRWVPGAVPGIVVVGAVRAGTGAGTASAFIVAVGTRHDECQRWGEVSNGLGKKLISGEEFIIDE
jgi:hypothetical protein